MAAIFVLKQQQCYWILLIRIRQKLLIKMKKNKQWLNLLLFNDKYMVVKKRFIGQIITQI